MSKIAMHIYVPSDTRDILRILARRDKTTVARKAVDIIKNTIELGEDTALAAIVERRMKGQRTKRWLTHEEVWGTGKETRKS
jgi:predicted DNA-binding protein